MSDVPIRHESDARRFSADVGAEAPAVLTYAARPDGALDLQHTIVPPEARGRGVADALVRAAVAHARAHDVRLVPTCPYVAEWVARNASDAEHFVTDPADPTA
jgi:hypothetical protein